MSDHTNRRKFIKKSALWATGFATATLPAWGHAEPPKEGLYLVGPREGFTPRIGTLLSTMTMMRSMLVQQVESLSTEQLDFQVDDQSNSIGAMLMHLAATEKYYQLNTFNNMAWGSWGQEVKDEWDVPMGLGQAARKKIKGHTLDYYLDRLEEVRAHTIEQFAKLDDRWLEKSEPFFGGQPTNNHAKWFHVCEHESNHNGQIKFIKKRFS